MSNVWEGGMMLMRVLTVLVLCGASGLEAQRPYWPTPVESLAVGHTTHTHAAVRGVVTYIGHEDDQDLHVRLRGFVDTLARVVTECIPRLPCLLPSGLPWIPRVGDTVTVYGITRRDPEHKWWEIHPVEGVEP